MSQLPGDTSGEVPNLFAPFVSSQLEELYRASQNANGTIYEERPGLITYLNPDAIANYARNIGDDNPLWAGEVDKRGPFAPPSILAGVRYPLLHGKGSGPDLSGSVGELEFRWFRPLRAGDRIIPVSRQTSVVPALKEGTVTSVQIGSVTSYNSLEGTTVAQARGTVTWGDVRLSGMAGQRRMPRAYDAAEVRQITERVLARRRMGRNGPPAEQTQVGAEMPLMVQPPLSVPDIVLWEMAIGHTYKTGIDALRDSAVRSHAYRNSVATGWPRQRNEAHIDHFAAGAGGMPLPFDNGVMRFTRLSIALTDWIGDRGRLEHLVLRLHRPMFYGDVSVYKGRITGRRDHPDATILTMDLSVSDWDGLLLASGEAAVQLPPKSEDQVTSI